MQTALITGSSAGIGKETAYVYAKNKYNLVLVARRIDSLNQIKKEIEDKYNVSVTVIAQDLATLESAKKLYSQILDSGIVIDVLINNAGFGDGVLFNESDYQRNENMLILNIVTLTHLTKLFLADMVKRKSGNIVNIASAAAYQGIPNLAIYAASKAYVLHFTEALAFELKNTNVKVTAICPGATQSEFASVANLNEKTFSKAPTAKALAEYIFKSMQKGKVNATHGFKNRLLVFVSRFSPRKMNTLLAGKIME